MKKLHVGLTGGIASGKSSVSQLFNKHGVNVIDADKIARQLFIKNSPHLLSLREYFGDSIFHSNGELNRQALREKVFNSEKDLNWLNQFTHPLVNQQMKAEISAANSDYVLLDIPLLIDKTGQIPNHLKQLVDRILVVKVDLETQLKRICQRDKSTREQAQKIIGSQSSLEQKLVLADDIIDNNGSLEELESQVSVLHNQYLTMTRT